MPFFSVVIPTVGRLAGVEMGMRSVLAQSFGDLELIVSDNSGDGRTKPLVDRFCGDPRVRYARPQAPMNLPNHWEFATLQAGGQYVLVLTDRIVMRPSAMEFLHQLILAHPEHNEVVCWFDRTSFDARARTLSGMADFHGGVEVQDSKALLQAYAKFEVPRTRLPHASNSCYHRDLAARIRADLGRLFVPVTTDFSTGFHLLAYADRILYADTALYVGTAADSRGSSGRRHEVYGSKFFSDALGGMDLFDKVPTKIDVTDNLLMNDLLTAKARVGGRLASIEIEPVSYGRALYREIVGREAEGAFLDVPGMFAQWRRYAEGLPAQERQELLARAAELDKRRRPFRGRLMKLGRRMGLHGIAHAIWGKARQIRQRLAGARVYKDSLDAARETDSILSGGPGGGAAAPGVPPGKS